MRAQASALTHLLAVVVLVGVPSRAYGQDVEQQIRAFQTALSGCRITGHVGVEIGGDRPIVVGAQAADRSCVSDAIGVTLRTSSFPERQWLDATRDERGQVAVARSHRGSVVDGEIQEIVPRRDAAPVRAPRADDGPWEPLPRLPQLPLTPRERGGRALLYIAPAALLISGIMGALAVIAEHGLSLGPSGGGSSRDAARLAGFSIGCGLSLAVSLAFFIVGADWAAPTARQRRGALRPTGGPGDPGLGIAVSF